MEDALEGACQKRKRYIDNVLILVFMEDALEVFSPFSETKRQKVLILVFMEDTLEVGLYKMQRKAMCCLNPCFNGRCSGSTKRSGLLCELRRVLILVLMEDTLEAI